MLSEDQIRTRLAHWIKERSVYERTDMRHGTSQIDARIEELKIILEEK